MQASGLGHQSRRVVRKARRWRNRVATRFGAEPLAFIEAFGRDIAIAHRGTAADLAVIDQCFKSGQYDTSRIGRFPQAGLDAVYASAVALGRTPLILDCGANIGAGALWFAARYPAARVVGIEPDPGNFALLTKNCRGTAFALHQCGLDAMDGHAVLTDPGEGEWGFRTEATGNGIAVRMVCLRTIMASLPADTFAPFILKIDIEGAEAALFAADQAAYDAFPAIVMEPHDWMFHGQQTSRSFFRFHTAHERDFYFHAENIFSIKHPVLVAALAG